MNGEQFIKIYGDKLSEKTKESLKDVSGHMTITDVLLVELLDSLVYINNNLLDIETAIERIER